MHHRTMLRPLFAAFVLSSLAFIPACKKSNDAGADATITAESLEKAPDSVTEEQDNGTITWNISPQGQVKALVKTNDGKPVTKNLTGQLVWKGPQGEAKIPAALDEKSGLVVASGPKLEADITEVRYTFKVDGQPWEGTLHLPKGGTKELADAGKATAENPIPAGKVGPNGGTIQVVGDDKIEIVADKNTKQVRVYVLDNDYKPIPIGERKVKLGVVAAAPEVVALAPDPSGLFLTGKLVVVKTDPVKITVAVTVKEVTHVVLVGWPPGVHVVVGSRAPRLKLWVVAVGWGVPNIDIRVKTGPEVIVIHDDDDHIQWKGKGKGHHKFKHRW